MAPITALSMLHITNGDAAAASIAAAGIPGRVLPWRDVLHDGPVPDGLPLNRLSTVRARYLAGCGFGEIGGLLEDFRLRDIELERSLGNEEVVLWFEHDLYDQLQLLQLLDWFAQLDRERPRVTMICRGEYLGEVSLERLAELFPMRCEVTSAQLELGARAWCAFRSRTPAKLQLLLREDTSALPFLKCAVHRLLEEYPRVGSGLARSETQILAVVGDGAGTVREAFHAVQSLEDPRYLGDWSFWTIVAGLLGGREPLLHVVARSPHAPYTSGSPDTRLPEQAVAVTRAAERVLAGDADWIDMHRVDKWIGGVHLREDEVWRWDAEQRRIVDPA